MSSSIFLTSPILFYLLFLSYAPFSIFFLCSFFNFLTLLLLSMLFFVYSVLLLFTLIYSSTFSSVPVLSVNASNTFPLSLCSTLFLFLEEIIYWHVIFRLNPTFFYPLYSFFIQLIAFMFHFRWMIICWCFYFIHFIIGFHDFLLFFSLLLLLASIYSSSFSSTPVLYANPSNLFPYSLCSTLFLFFWRSD